MISTGIKRKSINKEHINGFNTNVRDDATIIDKGKTVVSNTDISTEATPVFYENGSIELASYEFTDYRPCTHLSSTGNTGDLIEIFDKGKIYYEGNDGDFVFLSQDGDLTTEYPNTHIQIIGRIYDNFLNINIHQPIRYIKDA